MNDRKIAFIICVNNETYFKECVYYINRLSVPAGYEIDALAIREADSMCAAYQMGMQSTDAKYKIYMHQDVCICNEHFLEEMLTRFIGHPKVGMLGMIGGTYIPSSGMVFSSWDEGKVDVREPDMAYYLHTNEERREDVSVRAIDGLLMATQYDIPWREDLFTDFDFYDVSQSCEFLRAGYQIRVPYQKTPWVIHDSGFAKLGNYEKNRRLFLERYAEFVTVEKEEQLVCDDEWEQLGRQLAEQLKSMMEAGQWGAVREALQIYHQRNYKSTELETISVMSEIQEACVKCGGENGFFDGAESYQEMYERYMGVRFGMRRMELGFDWAEYEDVTRMMTDGSLSYAAAMVFLNHTVIDKQTVLQAMAQTYLAAGQMELHDKAVRMEEELQGRKLPVAYSKGVDRRKG